VLVGHSVGEIAAAVFSGALSMAQGMDLSIDRGRIMQAADGRGAMASVPLSRREVEEELGRVDGYVTVAAVNGPNTTVVAGDRAAVDGLIARLAKSGVACRDLGVGYAFHSAHMDAHAAEMGRVLHGLQPAPPHTPCHSTLTGGKADAQAFDADYWARQMRAPVLFAPAILDLLDGGVDAFLEIGPQPVLTPALADCMMERGREALILPSIRSREPEPLTLARSLAQLYEAGAPVDWRQAAREGAWVDLPAYPWDRQPYWLVPSHGGERALRSSVARASAPESSSTPLDTPQAPSAADASSDGHVLVQRWQALPGLPGDARALDGHWLLLGGSASWSEALAAEITARGASCTRAGSAPPDLLDAESVSRLMGDVLKAPGRLLKGIVYAPASHPGSAPDSAMAAVREVGQLLQAIARAGFRDPPRLWLTLSAGERTLAQGALEGLSKAIAHEHADLRCTLVELEAGEQAHVRLADELAAGSAEHQLSLRHGSRFAARLARRGLEGLEAMALSPDRAYIVTGGDAQVLDMADALADRGARQIIVASPVSLPARQIDQLRTRLDRLQTLQVDLASRAALQAGLDKLQAEGWPALHGSVHLHHAWIRTGAASALGGMTGPSAMQDAGRTGLAIEECLAGVPLAFSLFIHPALSLLGAPQQADGLAAAGTWAALAGRARAGGRAACALAWGEAKGEDGLPLSIGADGDAVTLADALEAALVLAGLPIDEAPLAGAMRLDVRRWRQLFPKVAALSLIRDLDASGAPARAAAGSGQLRRELEACAPKQRRALLERSLRDVLAKVALLDPDKIGTNVPLATLGLDSFMGVELRNRLENDLGLSLSPTLVYSYPTIADVATYLANRMGLKLEKSEDRHGSPTQGHAAGPDLTSISEENLLTTFEDEIAALEKSTRN
jgi:acyl transferase domain-containing protein